MPREAIGAAQQPWLAAQKGKALALDQVLGNGLPVVLLQNRLVIQQIELRGRTDHMEVDDAAGPRGKMGSAEAHRVLLGRSGRGRENLGIQERSQRQRPNAAAEALK